LSKDGKIQTENLTCRIDKKLYDILYLEAEKKGISLNSLVNSLFKQYVSWGKNVEEVGFIPLSNLTIDKIFTKLDEKSIDEIAMNSGQTIPEQLILLNFHEVNFNNICSIIEILASRFGKVRTNFFEGGTSITIYHGINKKFSDFLVKFHQAMSEKLKFKLKINGINGSLVSFEITP
jgi:hypothetical protein